METASHSSLYDLFLEAAALDGSQREEFLRQNCGGDAHLWASLVALLENDRTDSFLEPFADNAANDSAEDDRDPLIGRQIGHYEIARRIGHGGMGNVYLAVRTEDYSTQVAIKLIRRGMDSEAIVRRFHDEMQFQAALGKHANIAQVLDAGETEDGLPYYVMEYVDGERIDHWCDQQQLPLAGRLALFREVCGAVQFAHQHTVIHRDLKPSNILVTAGGRPMLIDFGIAKVLGDSPELPSSDCTETGMHALTPEYASPEQIRGERLTTASDVYSLGVILYGLLTGRRPYRGTMRTPVEVLRVASDAAPPRPSDVVLQQTSETGTDIAETTPDEVASARGLVPVRLSRLLRGDLDRIVLKALHKEPDRRYASAEQLSADVDRYLRGLPVLAQPDSLMYRCKKFVRRNRVAVAFAALLAVALLGGIIGTTSQTIRAGAARRTAEAAQQEARREAETAKDVLDFFVLDMIGAADPAVDGHDVTVVELLKKAESQIADRFADRPEIRATLRQVLGQTYASLGLTQEALAQFQRAFDLRRGLYGPDHRDTLKSMAAVGGALDEVGRLDDAKEMLADAAGRCQRQLGSEDRLTLQVQASLGETLQTMGDYDQAEPLLASTLQTQERVLPEGDEQILTTMSSLIACVRSQGRLDDAEPLTRRFLDLARRIKGDAHPATMSAMNSLGLLLYFREKWQESLEVHEKLLTIAKLALPPGHWHIAIFEGNVGDCLVKLGRDHEAEPHLVNAYEGLKTTIGEDQNLTERRLDRVYRMCYRLGRLEEADRLHREAVLTRLRVAGVGESASVLRSLDEFVELARENGTFTGEDDFYRALVDYADSMPSDHPHRAQYLGNLGWALLQKGACELAEPLLVASFDERKETLGTSHGDVQWLSEALIDLYRKTSRPEKASKMQAVLASSMNAAD